MSFVLRMRLVACAAWLHGLLMLAAPDQYTSASYKVLFDLIGPRAWGALFMAAATPMIVLIGRRWWAGCFLAPVLIAWAGGLCMAIVTGDAQSLSGPIWVGLVAVIVTASIARPDVSRR